MDNDRLEILMGKFVDSEIEPSEQRLLESQLAADAQNRRLFEEFKTLHTLAQAQIAPLADAGRPFETVFAAAWKKSRRGQHRLVKTPVGLGRFVAGMAAGLLLAALVQVSMQSFQPQETAAPAGSSVQLAARPSGPDRILTSTAEDPSASVKNVDYYYYTDENGQRWMIEGFRETMKTQWVSYQDL